MRDRLSWLPALLLTLLLGGPRSHAELEPSAAPGEPRMWSPPNGTLDVARFPVLSFAFEREIADDPDLLSREIRLLDGTGSPVRLRVRRSARDSRVAIAHPEPGTRLEPAQDYFIEVGPGGPGAEPSVRSRFRTGGAKSVLCLQRTRDGVWQNRCPENYWREDPATGLDVCPLAPPDPESDGPCRCDVLGTRVAGAASLGGESAPRLLADYFDFCEARRPEVARDLAAHIAASRAHPYYVWFREVPCAIRMPELLADQPALERAFAERVRRSVELLESLARASLARALRPLQRVVNAAHG